MIEIHRESLAWAAGFFDGEGCITLSRHNDKYINLSLSIGQKLIDEELIWGESESLVKFREAVQIGNINGPYLDRRNSTSQICRYTASGYEQIQAIMAMLWPWLGDIKKDKWIKCRQEFFTNLQENNIASYKQRKVKNKCLSRSA